MPDTKITGMPSASALSGADVIPVVQGGVNKQATFTQVSTFVGGGGGSLSLNQAIVTSGATIGSPYVVPTNVQRVLLNKSSGAVSYVQLPLASSMPTAALAFGVLVKDLKGDAATHNITVEFTSGELCDGDATVVLSNAYDWVTVNPVPGGGAWYKS